MGGWVDGWMGGWVVVVCCFQLTQHLTPNAIMVGTNYTLIRRIAVNNAQAGFDICINMRFERKTAMLCSMLRFLAFCCVLKSLCNLHVPNDVIWPTLAMAFHKACILCQA